MYLSIARHNNNTINPRIEDKVVNNNVRSIKVVSVDVIILIFDIISILNYYSALISLSLSDKSIANTTTATPATKQANIVNLSIMVTVVSI